MKKLSEEEKFEVIARLKSSSYTEQRIDDIQILQDHIFALEEEMKLLRELHEKATIRSIKLEEIVFKQKAENE